MRLRIIIIAGAVAALGGVTGGTAAMASAPAAQSPAPASAPAPFPVYDSGTALVTAHPVSPRGRLVIKGRPVELASVTRDGPAFVAHVQGVLPASWKGKTLAAVAEG